jgi:hypothetical protein
MEEGNKNEKTLERSRRFFEEFVEFLENENPPISWNDITEELEVVETSICTFLTNFRVTDKTTKEIKRPKKLYFDFVTSCLLTEISLKLKIDLRDKIQFKGIFFHFLKIFQRKKSS